MTPWLQYTIVLIYREEKRLSLCNFLDATNDSAIKSPNEVETRRAILASAILHFSLVIQMGI